MAVSMNSGFMRSDYMISDAALPLRMEELDIEQLEQEAKFSDILGEIGEATVTEAPAAQENTAMTEKQPAVLGKVDKADDADIPELSKSELKALARAVALGKIKLDEIPEEYVTDVLLMVIAMMMLGIPEEEIPEAENESKEAVKPVQVDLKTAEAFLSKVQENTNISELLQIVSETAGVEIPEDMSQRLGVHVEKITVAQEISSEKTAAPVVNNVVTVEVDAEAENIPTVPDTVFTEQMAANDAVTADEQQSTGRSELQQVPETAQTEQIKLNEEFEQLRKMISEFSVKKSESEQPAQQSYTAQTMSTDNPAKSRMVSKSDELEMLKGATKPTQAELEMAIDSSAQAAKSENNTQAETNTGSDTQLPMEQMPQNITPDAPVVFVRSDGTEVEVRPAEIIRQITTTVVEQSSTAEGDTEYSITLTPEDLGNITVKLTKTVDGLMTVSITADNARTQRLIEQHGAALHENLRQNGIELENWQTVNQSSQQARAQDYSGSSRNPYYSGDSDSNDDEDADGASFAELITAM